jgi:hypothetical protein
MYKSTSVKDEVQHEAEVFSFYFQIYTNLYRVYVPVLNIKSCKFIQILSSKSITILPWIGGPKKLVCCPSETMINIMPSSYVVL